MTPSLGFYLNGTELANIQYSWCALIRNLGSIVKITVVPRTSAHGHSQLKLQKFTTQMLSQAGQKRRDGAGDVHFIELCDVMMM